MKPFLRSVLVVSTSIALLVAALVAFLLVVHASPEKLAFFNAIVHGGVSDTLSEEHPFEISRLGSKIEIPFDVRHTREVALGAKGGDSDWYGYCVDDPVNRVDMWGLWSLFGAEFGDDGRPVWQPKYGNWGGQDWSGGQNPKQHGRQDGDARPGGQLR